MEAFRLQPPMSSAEVIGSFEQLDDLPGKHAGQPGHDLRLGNALVQGMGAIALTKHRTASGHLVPGLGLRHALDLVEEMSMRPSCCRKNSPVPEAHLLPV